MSFILLLTSFAIILAGAILFTNAIEWLGHKLHLNDGAVGSILAAVGTAMPETLIPIIALLSGAAGTQEVAVGAIVGAPFLLATVAMALVGIAAIGHVKSRPQGVNLKVHFDVLERDLLFFGLFFGLALAIGVTDFLPKWSKVVFGILFIFAYIFYVFKTIKNGSSSGEEGEMDALVMDRRANRETNPPNKLIILQVLVGLGAMVGGSHIFVHELISIASMIGVSTIILALILAPLATELPEKINSYLWVREGKDSLALGNITGAMVFQSTVAVSIGLLFLDWHLGKFAALSMILGLLGGAIAFFALLVRKRFNLLAIIGWAGLYLIFLGFVIFA